MLKQSLFGAATLLLASNVFAGHHVGAYFAANADADRLVDGNSAELKGNGFGLFGSIELSAKHRIFFEYSAVEYDSIDVAGNPAASGSVDFDFVQLRLGYGRVIPLNDKLSITGMAEALNFRLESTGSENGLGVHSLVTYALADCIDIFGQLGYVSVDDVDGPEFKVGARWQVNDHYSLFTDYRASRLDGDDSEFDVDDFRIGVAIPF